MMKLISIELSTTSKYDSHKLSVSPSVVVNPPAIQYFKGVHREWLQDKRLFNDTDDRFVEMKSHLVTCLSSDEYPNPPICTKSQAEKIADYTLHILLRKINGTTPKFEKIQVVVCSECGKVVHCISGKIFIHGPSKNSHICPNSGKVI